MACSVLHVQHLTQIIIKSCACQWTCKIISIVVRKIITENYDLKNWIKGRCQFSLKSSIKIWHLWIYQFEHLWIYQLRSRRNLVPVCSSFWWKSCWCLQGWPVLRVVAKVTTSTAICLMPVGTSPPSSCRTGPRLPSARSSLTSSEPSRTVLWPLVNWSRGWTRSYICTGPDATSTALRPRTLKQVSLLGVDSVFIEQTNGMCVCGISVFFYPQLEQYLDQAAVNKCHKQGARDEIRIYDIRASLRW